MPLNKDLREFVESLNASKVEYLLVGAHAVAWYGLVRNTKDIDFFVRKGVENGSRIVQALDQFGLSSLDVTAADFAEDDQILQIGYPPNRIDMITSIAGVSFEDAWAAREAGDIDGIPVQYIGLTELLRNKETAARPQDLADAARLRQRHPEVK